MAAPGDPGGKGPGSELIGLQPDDGVRQATGGANPRQRDRAGSIGCEHRLDGNSHGARRNQSPGQQPTLAVAAWHLREHCSPLLLRSDHFATTGVRNGPAVHIPNLYGGCSLAVAGGEIAPSHRHRRGAGLDRRGDGDPAGMAWCGPNRTGNTTRNGSPGRSPVYGSGLRVRPPSIHQRTPLGDHSLFPTRVNSLDAADGDSKRSLASGTGLALVTRSRCLDPTWPDLGHQGAELPAGGEGDIVELRAGGVCSELGLDLVKRIDHRIHMHGCSVGAERLVHQPLQPSDLINLRASRGDRATNAGPHHHRW